MVKKLLPIASMEKIMKNAGAGRVSQKAKAALKAELEIYANNLANNAIKLARHAGRKTVKAQDIMLASH